MNFNASASNCQSGNCSYEWSFGGEGSGTGTDTATPSFGYTTGGTYSISLTMTDNGITGSPSSTLTKTATTCTINLAPACDLGDIAFDGRKVTLGDAESRGTFDTVVITWGDSQSTTASTSTDDGDFSHTYGANSMYTIRKSVKNSLTGAISNCAPQSVTVPKKFNLTVNVPSETAANYTSVKVLLNGVTKAQGSTGTTGKWSTFIEAKSNYKVQVSKVGKTFDCDGTQYEPWTNPVDVDLSSSAQTVNCAFGEVEPAP
jgi:hypothetical protein